MLQVDNDIPLLVYWMGEPLSNLPREELENLFIAAHARINELERELCDLSIQHIQDLGRLARR